MRIANVAVIHDAAGTSSRRVDMIITNQSVYRAWNHQATMLNGQFAQINLQMPQPYEQATYQEVELELQLVEAQTSTPIMPSSFQLTFFDFDQEDMRGNGQECVSLPINDAHSGIVEVSFVSNQSEAKVNLAASAMRRGWLDACSREPGVGADNPTSPLLLTSQQRAKAIAVTYVEVSRVRLVFSIRGNGWGGRNFLVGGTSNILPICELNESSTFVHVTVALPSSLHPEHGTSLRFVVMARDSSESLFRRVEAYLGLPPHRVALATEDGKALHAAHPGGIGSLAIRHTLTVFATVSNALEVHIDGSALRRIATLRADVVEATVVSTLIATVTASFVAHAVAASVPTASGSGAAASPHEGNVGSGMLTLVHGMQRFVSYEGLAGNISEDQVTVSNKISWVQGSTGFNIISDAVVYCSWNSTNASQTFQNPVNALLNVIMILCIVIMVLFAGQVVTYVSMTRLANRRFYQRKRDPKRVIARMLRSERQASGSHLSTSLSTSSAALLAPVKFVPYPSHRVFPGLPLIVVSLFCSGLVNNSVKVLAAGDLGYCDETWIAIAVIILFFVVIYNCLTLRLLMRFHRRFVASTWKAAQLPAAANAVGDPLYRLISRIRVCSRGKPVDRVRGKFARPPNEVKEPGRTERILAHPTRVFHELASDTLDSIGFALMARSGGARLTGVLFEFIVLGANILIAALSGIRLIFEPGSDGALAQMFAIITVQVCVATYVFCAKPSADRVMNLLVGTQFALEACSTAIVLAAASSGSSGDAKEIAFFLAIASLTAPVFQRFYDAIIVQISRAVRNDGFSWKGAFFSFLGMIVFIPTMVLNLLGLGMGWTGKLVEGAADDVNKLTTKAANEGLVHRIQEGQVETASTLFWMGAVRAEERRATCEESVARAARAIKLNRHCAAHEDREASSVRFRGGVTPEQKQRCHSGVVGSTPCGQHRLDAALVGGQHHDLGYSAVVERVRSEDISERPGFSWLGRVMREEESQDDSIFLRT